MSSHPTLPAGARALVIGGSIAGLCAARVLADHFAQVDVLERDRLPDGATSRPGVPQDRQVHILLARGGAILNRLFPGFADDLEAAGAVPVDLTRSARSKVRGRWLQRFTSGHTTHACSRLLLEAALRRRVAALPGVTLHAGAVVTGLVLDGRRVTGVRVRARDGDGGERVESADFAVDASGRSSRLPHWLADAGYPPVAETVIDARVGYAGRRYRTPTDPAVDWHIMLIGPDARSGATRGGVIYAEENGVWSVLALGMMGDFPPTDEDGFLAFAHSVDPAFHAAIAAAEPLTPIIGYRKTENRYRHLERLPHWPERLVAVGDAVCGFNPVYGQGMTVAAMAAEALEAALRRGRGTLDGVAPHFQKQYPKVVAPAWLLATSSDLEWLGTRQATTFAERLAGRYLPLVLAALPEDRVIHETFVEVQHLTQPPAALFHPRIVWRAVRYRLRHGGGGRLDSTQPQPA